MEFYDRVPTYPGRVKLVPVSGQANTYDMVRADEPTVEGTPIDKALFDSFGENINVLQKQVSDTLFALSQRVILNNVALGTEIGLYENGVLVPFIVVRKSYEGNDRVLVVRKNAYKVDSLLAEDEYFYTDCKTDLWLNNEYTAILDEATRSVLSEVTVDVSVSGMLSSIKRKVFLLSTYEYNVEPSLGRYEGDGVPYFDTNEKRIVMFNGSLIDHYTRTVDSDAGENGAELITATGVYGETTNAATTLAGIRPAFTLPLDYEATVGVPSTANVMATAEVI